jgi:hypothetical protein
MVPKNPDFFIWSCMLCRRAAATGLSLSFWACRFAKRPDEACRVKWLVLCTPICDTEGQIHDDDRQEKPEESRRRRPSRIGCW